MSTHSIRTALHPNQKLTPNEWQALLDDALLYRRTVSIEKLCRERGIGRATFYAKLRRCKRRMASANIELGDQRVLVPESRAWMDALHPKEPRS